MEEVKECKDTHHGKLLLVNIMLICIGLLYILRVIIQNYLLSFHDQSVQHYNPEVSVVGIRTDKNCRQFRNQINLESFHISH